MLSEREIAIKEALIDEMEELSYSQHRNIKDDIDAEFVEQESMNLKKAQRRLTILALVAVAIILVYVGITVQESPISKALPPVVLALAFIMLAVGHLTSLTKRRMALRIFKILAENSTGT